MTRTSKDINRNWRMKVYGTTGEGCRINTLMGVTGIISLIGEDFLDKFITRAESSMADSCTCKLRRGIKITFYAR